jgi:hypothetical protein
MRKRKEKTKESLKMTERKMKEWRKKKRKFEK